MSSIRQGQQPSSAAASTSQPAAAQAQPCQVDLKLNNNGKSTMTADMVLWTAGSSPASHDSRKLNLPFDTNPIGATLTDRNLQVLKQARVFALGDVAGSEIEAETANLAPTAQVSVVACNQQLSHPSLQSTILWNESLSLRCMWVKRTFGTLV